MSTASSTRFVLLPDDSVLLELLARAEQLLELITACEQDTANNPDEPTPWRLPDPLADGLATNALRDHFRSRGVLILRGLARLGDDLGLWQGDRLWSGWCPTSCGSWSSH